MISIAYSAPAREPETLRPGRGDGNCRRKHTARTTNLNASNVMKAGASLRNIQGESAGDSRS
jgi:hypothetical protein